jgi:hypothetical protein
MNRTRLLSRSLLLAMPLAAAITLGSPGAAEAQYAPPPPPAAYIATAQPEYFEGRAVYFYNNQWYYREGRAWNYYRTEPAYLRDRRVHVTTVNHARYHYHR